MRLWLALRDASRGWADIVRGRQDWRGQFALGRSGLITALVIYFFFAFLSIVYGSLGTGMPSPLGVFIGLAVQALSILALGIAIGLARIVLQGTMPVLDLLVPGIYALVYYLVAGSIVSSLGAQMLGLVLVGLGYLLYRLGRVAGGWTIGVCIAFAVFTVVLLVAMPLTLYMLATPAGSPI